MQETVQKRANVTNPRSFPHNSPPSFTFGKKLIWLKTLNLRVETFERLHRLLTLNRQALTRDGDSQRGPRTEPRPALASDCTQLPRASDSALRTDQQLPPALIARRLAMAGHRLLARAHRPAQTAFPRALLIAGWAPAGGGEPLTDRRWLMINYDSHAWALGQG